MRQLLPTPLPGEGVDLVALYGRMVCTASGRPAVRINMIASADGAASAGGLSGDLGGPGDKVVFAALRSLADIILVGSSTLKAERYRPVRLGREAQQRRTQAGMTAVPPIAVLTGTCRLDWTSPFFANAGQRPLVITVDSADADDRARAAQAADVIVAGQDRVDLTLALKALGERGFDDVLAEGGPSIIGQLAVAGYVDQLCLTLAPKLAVGKAPRIATGAGLDPLAGLSLRSLVEDDGFLFLCYERA